MILQSLLHSITPILKKHSVAHASVFGSFARGTEQPDSDLDILVQLPDRTSLFDVVRLELELEDKLGRKVDIVTSDTHLHPIIQERILLEQVVIF